LFFWCLDFSFDQDVRKPMATDSKRKSWVAAAMVAGVSYFLIGFGFAAFARWKTLGLTALTWNRLAFLFSAIVFAAHIIYENTRIDGTPRKTAWRSSLAVALGAFGLALAANIHDLGSPAGYRQRMLVALIAWPLITAVPAFFAALIVCTVFTLAEKKAYARPGGIQ
jgi:hypothetical protein